MPKGFFPQQDTGRLIGGIQADQSISFQLMEQKLHPVCRHHPQGSRRSTNVVGFTGGGQTNSGFVFVALKPLSERKVSADQVIARLRGKLDQVAGRQALSAGGAGYLASAAARATRSTSTRCKPTTPERSYDWAPKVEAALQKHARC